MLSVHLFWSEILGDEVDEHVRVLVHQVGALVLHRPGHDLAQLLQTVPDRVLVVLVLDDLVKLRDGVLAEDALLVGLGHEGFGLGLLLRFAEAHRFTHLRRSEPKLLNVEDKAKSFKICQKTVLS